MTNLKIFRILQTKTMPNKKKCKGIHKYTYGFGCGEMVEADKRKFGIGRECGCWKKFLKTSNGEKYIKSFVIPKAKKKTQKEQRKKHNEEKRKLDTKGAMRLADMYFSRYIRVKHSINGKCTCYTCGTIKDIKEVDNGHYQKREHKATRYHEDNCRCQCKICNGDTKHNGKQAEFRVNLSNEIGEEKVIEIERLARTTIKANSKFYRDIANKYRIKLNELQKQLKVKYF